ncbi:MAG TPA: hypothetical protein VK983_01325 [Candidatus Limnocylindrales bacterium]|nr:hypothetical protein [Candidatus Limnocylindrales bacterium]
MAEVLSGVEDQNLMYEIKERVLLSERFGADEGGAKSAFVGFVAGVIAVGALAYGIKGQIIPNLPEQVATPDKNELSLKTVAVVPQPWQCNSTMIGDAAGTGSRVKYDVGGKDIPSTGYGMYVEQGKFKFELCAPGSAFEVKPTTASTGQRGFNVHMDITKLAVDAEFISDQTHIVPIDPPVSQIGGGLIDGVSGLARAGCGIITLGKQNKACDSLNALSKWNKDNSEDLRRATMVKILEEARKRLGPAEYQNQLRAIEDYYEQQAVDDGMKPEQAAKLVNLIPVDQNGKPTKAIPDFTKGTMDELYKQGILDKNDLGGPEVVFEKVRVDPLPESGYKEKITEKKPLPSGAL